MITSYRPTFSPQQHHHHHHYHRDHNHTRYYNPIEKLIQTSALLLYNATRVAAHFFLFILCLFCSFPVLLVITLCGLLLLCFLQLVMLPQCFVWRGGGSSNSNSSSDETIEQTTTTATEKVIKTKTMMTAKVDVDGCMARYDTYCFLQRIDVLRQEYIEKLRAAQLKKKLLTTQQQQSQR